MIHVGTLAVGKASLLPLTRPLKSSGSRNEDLRAGEVAPIQERLAERVHRHARRLDTTPLVQRATGRVQEVEPFLRFLASA